MRLNNADGRLQPEQWLNLLSRSIAHVVMGRSWSNAFRLNGISEQQRHTSMYVHNLVGLTREQYPTMKPTAAEIQFLFGMRNIPYDLLMPEPPPSTHAEFLAAHSNW
jgi:hypothetical protein